ncbi:MAG TPA: autotransporter-associated beta strand repeat-containing protein [Verrucomicrobiae bacterium]|nr:autotransporter-associated beta strand repeat-containing protein [Verrucomicrobiae bacterium]
MKEMRPAILCPCALWLPRWSVVLALLLLAACFNLSAAVVTWTGGAVSGNWSVGANWDSGSAPQNNDSLVFNAAVGAGQITNNLSGRTFAQISFIGVGSSFFVYGNAITLTGGITQSSTGGANTFHPDITLATNNQTFAVTGSGVGSGLQISGDINLNGRNMTVNVTDAGTELNLSGSISGSGNITRGTGAGGLRFSGSAANTFTGTVAINSGYIAAAKANGVTSLSGDVVIGNSSGVDTLLMLTDNQFGAGADVTLRDGGILDNNNETNVIGSLTFNDGGTVETTTGRLEIGGTVSVIGSGVSNSVINGNLHLGSATRLFNIADTPRSADLEVNGTISGGNSGGLPFFSAGLTKAGAGLLSLNAANTYGGPTTVNDGQLRILNNQGLGSTFALFGSAGTVVNSNAVLMLADAHITNEVLTLNSTNPSGALQNTATATWDGQIALGADVTIEASSAFGIAGPITGPGGFTKIGASTLTLFGTNVNTYAGTTFVNAGTLVLNVNGVNDAIPGPLVIGDGIGAANSDVVRLARLNQIANTSRITINSSGLWDLEGFGDAIGSLAGTGNVELGAATLNIGFDNTTATFDGVISGTGGVNKFLNTTGTQRFTGNNLYTGVTTINGGTLIVNGTQPDSTAIIGEFGTLAGHGRVGRIQNSAGGIVSPGDLAPGTLIGEDLLLGAGSELVIEITGTDFDHDALSAIGTNQVGGALTLSVPGPFVPVEGDQFTIVVNDGVEPIIGTFAGLPNHSLVSAGLHKFRINYDNDIVLTYTNSPIGVLNPQITSGNGNGTLDPNECNTLSLVVTNQSGVPLANVSAILSATGHGVVVTQPESAYPNLAVNGHATNITPFQVSTLPSFECSEEVQLKLTITSDNGSFARVITVPSGFTGTPLRFNNNVNAAIPDSASITSSVAVAGITTPIRRVRVSLYVTHTANEDLEIALMSPDGTIVNLSSDNGGTGDDYGSDCIDDSRTLFDDAAATAITAGAPPYVGTFRPEQQLSAFIGKEAVDANGTWRLILRDDSGGAVGTLRCWSLFISPTECSSGGGACETCPGVFTGSITNTDAVQMGRLTRSGTGSTCAESKVCPGLEHDLPRNYDVYNFTNSSSSEQCVYTSLTVHGAQQTMAAAYLGSYDPANLCNNYLADLGFSTSQGNSLPFSMVVPANSAFAVVVNQVDAGVGSDYTLVVSGLQCQPLLEIDPAPADRVRLHWSTSAAGFQLEGNDLLQTANWSSITNEPIVVDGRFSVTNSSVSPTNRFYRLNRP